MTDESPEKLSDKLIDLIETSTSLNQTLIHSFLAEYTDDERQQILNTLGELKSITPLMAACGLQSFQGNDCSRLANLIEVIECLIKYGSDVNIRENKSNMTALMFALKMRRCVCFPNLRFQIVSILVVS